MPHARVLSHLTASTSSHVFCHAPRRPTRRYQITYNHAIATETTSEIVTFEEVQDIARTRGIYISVKSLGPLYRLVCRDGDENGPILGVTSGFTMGPFGLMHCDTLQIFTKGKKGEQGSRVRGGILGLGLLIGGATFAFGYEQGCKVAEILAINDDDYMHNRLVRYYNRFGFEPVYVVTGGKIADLPHMLVWGGAGTRMDANIEAMLKKWTKAIRNSRLLENGAEEGGSEGS